ncbi:MAG: V-type ATP synthase subunit I [Oscillospiraceae bacterium]
MAMQKIELLASISDSKRIIDFLQRKGLVEVSKHDVDERMYTMDTSVNISQLQKFLDTVKNAQEILSFYAPLKTKLTDSFKAPVEIEIETFEAETENTDVAMQNCYQLIEFQKSIISSKADIIRYETLNEALIPWEKLDVPMDLTKTKYTSVLIGTFPGQLSEEDIISKLAEISPNVEAVEAEVISSENIQTCAVILCMQNDTAEISEAIRSFGFLALSTPQNKTTAEAIKDNKAKIDELRSNIDSYIKNIEALKSERGEIDFLVDYFTMRAEKYDALKSMSMSQNIFYLSGYVPKKYSNQIVSQLEKKYAVGITISEPSDDEDVPVYLENNGFAAPVEEITEMYSLPGKNDIDPNGIMAFFYYLFFGMMFSDAGYGLILVIATMVVLLKFKPQGKMKNTVKMYMYCGISTIFWGIMFGSFFGDIINIIRTNFLNLPAMRLYLWLDPQNDDLMATMLWCFLFGLIHLFVGVAIKGYMQWRQGEKLGAICDTLSIYLAVGGAAPICAGMVIDVPSNIKTIGSYCAVIGVALIVLTAGRSSKGIFGKLGSGLYALYNTISGYLSDTLSYSRLLALGLVTSIIGNVVNMMGALPTNKISKVLLLTVAFIIGHAINFGINIIGAYVHTNRLQYVEFFSRFYEGGGKAFNPLKVNSKAFKFKEEINNE